MKLLLADKNLNSGLYKNADIYMYDSRLVLAGFFILE